MRLHRVVFSCLADAERLSRRAILLFPALLLLASPPVAAIAKVKDIGSGSFSFTPGGGTIPITVPAGGVVAGNLVVISIVTGGDAAITGGGVAVTDSRGNAYTADAQSAAWGTNRRTFIRSSRIATALQPADTITVTVTGTPGFGIEAAASATEFSSIAVSPLDKTASGTGMSTSATTAATATTAQASELLIGAIGIAGGANVTPGAGYTALPGGFAANVQVWPQFRIVAATGAFTASATFDGSVDWGAVITTYKGDACATDMQNPTVTAPANSTVKQTVCN